MVKKEGIIILKDRKYLKAENNDYNKLVEDEYTPQGVTNDFKKVIVFRIKIEHKNNEKKDIYFNNWPGTVYP